VTASRVEVRGERAVLSPDAPDRWVSGTQLQGLLTSPVPGTGLPAHHAVDPESVVVRHQGRVLERGVDYVLDPVWGSLGLGPSPTFPPGDEVKVYYRYSLIRIDTLVRTADGSVRRVEGESRLTAPEPPPLAPGESRVANYFVDYHDDSEGTRFDVLADGADAPTLTTGRGLSGAVARLDAGLPVKVVCWGDSVTTGAEASSPERAFPALLADGLRAHWPSAPLDVGVIAVGGSNSAQWLGLMELPDVFDPAEVTFERVAGAEPDVLIVEFVNDTGFDIETLGVIHKELVARVRALGCEVVLVTPHFTMAEMMGVDDLRTPEVRPQPLALHDLAETEGWAVADASARWAHLWREGIPFPTMLVNGINHPDDRGHRIFAEELLACFGVPASVLASEPDFRPND
jgi:hypothetical protein